MLVGLLVLLGLITTEMGSLIYMLQILMGSTSFTKTWVRAPLKELLKGILLLMLQHHTVLTGQIMITTIGLTFLLPMPMVQLYLLIITLCTIIMAMALLQKLLRGTLSTMMASVRVLLGVIITMMAILTYL